MKDVLPDSIIVEAVGRHGGYEEIERVGKWGSIANSIGVRKDRGEEIKQRYEDLLRLSAEQDQDEEENDEDFEVEEILDRREEEGQIKYLVKWKDDPLTQTWEPSTNLSCPDLVEEFEEARRRQLGLVEAGKRRAGEEPSPAITSISTAGPPAGQGAKRARYEKVIGLTKPRPEGSSSARSTKFLVELVDGSQVFVDGTELRAEAPHLLLDFYEARLKFTYAPRAEPFAVRAARRLRDVRVIIPLGETRRMRLATWNSKRMHRVPRALLFEWREQPASPLATKILSVRLESSPHRRVIRTVSTAQSAGRYLVAFNRRTYLAYEASHRQGRGWELGGAETLARRGLVLAYSE
eukprot:CAMPEP_0195608380 /NCGR_PEP_ID=MMETSP0815-20121206/8712_1 /TAXON_ID=97485 /ORGANISM="Prymnesium parvum, Strain Texoma1" /LENGTH=350 /DNA_ID=CAMNT_0040748233 /DNA_START=33 /DNA_END=1087 /DNA_ORIENTATION=+